MTFWQKLDRYPPVLLRLLARNADGTAMTDEDLFDASAGLGLTRYDIKALSYATSWARVEVSTARAFMQACGLDLEDPKTVRNLNRYVKNPKFKHLRSHKDWPQFKEMLRVYAESQL